MHKLAKTILFGALMLIAVRGECSGSRVSIGTNTIGYLAFATPNLDLGVSLHRHWSIHLQGKYNPFWWDVAGAQFQHRQLTASLGARYWPWYVFSGWNYGASFQYSLYNRGGILSPSTEEGEGYGLSLSGGYALMINRWMNLEFGLGIWGGVTRYKEYNSPRCGKLVGQGTKFFILPDDISVSVVFTF